MERLGIVLSTTESRLMENTLFVDQLRTVNLPVVIVNQCKSRMLNPGTFPPHVQVVNSNSKGLSASRNLALDALQAEFAMLCDDDIMLQEGCLDQLIPQLQSGVAMYFTPLHTTEGHPWRRHYPEAPFYLRGLSFANRKRIQKINSMEQIVNRNFMRENQLRFNESFGAGSGKYPMGEETLLAFELLKCGGQLQFLPIPTRIHPPVSTATHLNGEKYRAIRAIHRRVFSPFGDLVFVAFFLKTLLFKRRR